MGNVMMWSDTADNGHLVIAGSEHFKELRWAIAKRLLETEPVNHGKWQQLDVSGSDAHKTYELLNLSVWYEMPQHKVHAIEHIEPDLPWAEGHFQERVAGEAVNPGDWHDKWPYHAGQVKLHQHGGKYGHNYMERFWPTDLVMETQNGRNDFTGYRFGVGDLNDVVDQLGRDPGTRQAYLPIFFPEDTGATQGQRVPCTLGYHFIIRDGLLHLTYNMRSCEIYRHFTNDTYMAVRLAHWVCEQWNRRNSLGVGGDITPGQLTMHIVSMHGFKGDTEAITGFQNA